MNLTQIAHAKVAEFAPQIKYAVDATAGCGRDALFAAKLLAEGGAVFCFDVQREAIERTRALLAAENLLGRAALFNAGHEHMLELLPAEVVGRVNCFFFNLGWLPNSDKRVATRAGTTVAALEAALQAADKGLCALSVLCYKGHAGGLEEFLAVEEFFKNRNIAAERFCDASNALSPELFFAKMGGAKK